MSNNGKYIPVQERDIVIQIMHLAYLVQTQTKYCVMLDYAGHVNSLTVSIRESKDNWRNEVLRTEFYDAYAELSKNNVPSWLASAQSKVNVLQRILNEHQIPYDDCDVTRYFTDEYSF